MLPFKEQSQAGAKLGPAAQPNGLAQIAFRQLIILQFGMRISQSVVVLGLFGVRQHSPLQHPNRTRAVPALMHQAAHQVKRVRLIRNPLKHLPVNFRSFLKAPSAVKCQPPLQFSISLMHNRQNTTIRNNRAEYIGPCALLTSQTVSRAASSGILPESNRPVRSPLMRRLVPILFLSVATLHAPPSAAQAASTPPQGFAVGPQYGTTHVYVAPADMDALVTSFVATFGGAASKPGVTNIAPVPSSTAFQAVSTPAGLLSVFGFQTPIPYPFGQERTGYRVTDMDQAIETARVTGAEVIVAPFKDPIGIDAIIQWPGGVKMQLYWHFKASTNPPLETIPENRVYVSPDRADAFVRGFVAFSGGRVLSDDKLADAGEIGRSGETYRRIRITSDFGNMLVLVTDGHLPYPFGYEITGYEVHDLDAILVKARAAGVKTLSPPYASGGRSSTIVEFPGGYIAEVHSVNPTGKQGQEAK